MVSLNGGMGVQDRSSTADNPVRRGPETHSPLESTQKEGARFERAPINYNL
jgi:hypothetical protein